MRLPGRGRRKQDRAPGGAGSPAGARSPAGGSPEEAGGDARFQPGGTSEAAARDYAERVGLSDPADREEDPRRRAARLRRRRRLLLWGGIPALLVIAVAVWMCFVSLMTVAASRAAVHEDYLTAVSRYQAVERANPWLEQWRVHYNLGTAHLLADQLDEADLELSEALTTAPKAEMVTYQDADGNTAEILDPEAPECLIRVNLYVTRIAQAQAATDAGDTAGAEALTASAVEAAGECEVPPPPEPDPTASPSPSSSQTPTSDPSEPPSPSPSESTEASASPSPGESGSPTPDPSASASASPSPTSGQKEDLLNRNRDANETAGAGVDNGRRW